MNGVQREGMCSEKFSAPLQQSDNLLRIVDCGLCGAGKGCQLETAFHCLLCYSLAARRLCHKTGSLRDAPKLNSQLFPSFVELQRGHSSLASLNPCRPSPEMKDHYMYSMTVVNISIWMDAE